MNSSPVRHVLVPHDFGDIAEHALVLALDLAEELRAHVTILHVCEIPVYSFPEIAGATTDMAADVEREAERALECIVKDLRRPKVDLDTAVRRGTAWREIVAFGEEERVGLITMGTHGRRGFARALLGSVAEKVVRAASCAVLTVRGSPSTSPTAARGRPVPSGTRWPAGSSR